MRGWFIVENGVWYWYKNYMPRDDAVQLVEEEEEEKDSKAIANLFLLFPVPYFISVFPHSLSRWLFFTGHNVKYQGTIFTATLIALSGTFNTILFFFTRPELVVGSADSSPTPGPLPFADSQIRQRNSTSQSSRFGSLPNRSPIASDNVIPLDDLERNGNGRPGIRLPYNSILVNSDPVTPVEEEPYGHLSP